jgi:hypothetical protein
MALEIESHEIEVGDDWAELAIDAIKTTMAASPILDLADFGFWILDFGLGTT